MPLFLVLLAGLFLCGSAQGQRLQLPNAPKSVQLYSWRNSEGKVIFGLQIGNQPESPEKLISDGSLHLSDQAALAKAFEKLRPDEPVLWHHRNPQGRDCLPPEDIEVETKETALKRGLNLVIADAAGLEPEYWNQPRGRFDDAVKKIESAATDSQRMEALRSACKEAYAIRLYPEAKKYALQLEKLAPQLKENIHYGDAVQDFNIVLGRVAIQEGDVDSARGYLLGAGYSPGSPRMNTMGPDMSLAYELLQKGERRVVLDYLDLCRNFWKSDHGLIDEWTLKIKHNEVPDFGSNLPK